MRTRMTTARRMNNGILAIEIHSRNGLYGALWRPPRYEASGEMAFDQGEAGHRRQYTTIICIPATSDCGGGSERGTAAFRRLLVL